MLHIKFINKIDSSCISDYDVEKTYQSFKAIVGELSICNTLLLTRFRLGVKRKEIEPFEITVVDIDGTEVNEVCSINGTLCDVWATKILSQDLNMSMEIM